MIENKRISILGSITYMDYIKVARVPAEPSRLGDRGDRPLARGHQSGAGARGPELDRGALRAVGPVRAAAADG